MDPITKTVVIEATKAGVQKLAGKVVSTVKESLFKKKEKIKLQSYFETKLEQFSRIFSLLNPERDRYLRDIYEPLSLAYATSDDAQISITPKNSQELFNISSKSFIQGTGGSGKTTITKYWFINNCFDEIFSIYIELRNMNDSETLEEYIYAETGINLFKFLSNKEQSINIYFDGMDELSVNKFELISKNIRELLNAHSSQINAIITSRPSDRIKGWNGFKYYNIKSLRLEQAKAIVAKYNEDIELTNNFIKALEERLFKEHYNCLSNPLLLIIMILVYKRNNGIPDQMAEYFQEAYEALYSRHDNIKNGNFKRIFQTKLTKYEFEHAFAYFSFLTYFNNHPSFTMENVRKYVSIMANRQEFKNISPENLIHDFEDNICLVVKDGRKYEFRHRLFQEYFAAKFLASFAEFNDSQIKKIFKKLSSRIVEDQFFELLLILKVDLLEKFAFLPALKPLIEVADQKGCQSVEAVLSYLTSFHAGKVIYYERTANNEIIVKYVFTGGRGISFAVFFPLLILGKMKIPYHQQFPSYEDISEFAVASKCLFDDKLDPVINNNYSYEIPTSIRKLDENHKKALLNSSIPQLISTLKDYYYQIKHKISESSIDDLFD